MAERVHLQYHAVTFRLLGRNPLLDHAALKRIKAAEQKSGRRLPAAVREWYSLRGASNPLRERRGDRFNPLTDILKGFKESTTRSPAYTANRLFIVSGNDRYSARLDGSDDRPLTSTLTREIGFLARNASPSSFSGLCLIDGCHRARFPGHANFAWERAMCCSARWSWIS
jgi:hypothetical protein